MKARFWFANLKKKCCLEENIKIDLRRTGRSDVGRINLAQNADKCRAVAKTVMNLRVP